MGNIYNVLIKFIRFLKDLFMLLLFIYMLGRNCNALYWFVKLSELCFSLIGWVLYLSQERFNSPDQCLFLHLGNATILTSIQPTGPWAGSTLSCNLWSGPGPNWRTTFHNYWPRLTFACNQKEVYICRVFLWQMFKGSTGKAKGFSFGAKFRVRYHLSLIWV